MMNIKMNAVNLCIILVIIVVITVSIRRRTARIMQGFVGSGSGNLGEEGVVQEEEEGGICLMLNVF